MYFGISGDINFKVVCTVFTNKRNQLIGMHQLTSAANSRGQVAAQGHKIRDTSLLVIINQR